MRRITLLTLLAIATTATSYARAAGPADEAGAKKALDGSSRHGEYVDVTVEPGKPPIRAWVVYPEVSGKAPVVIVIQEIFGLSDWLRAATDQLASDGFIAIAPDLVSGRGPNGGGTDSFPDRDAVVKATRDLTPEFTNKALDAVATYGKALPSSNGKTATVGFCWGGGASFAYAAHNKDLNAAVVAYGTPPKDAADFARVACPVFGFYGGDDARVTSTVPAAETAMKTAGKTYTAKVFDGAGHGFFRQQTGKDGANRRATDEGWPLLVEFLKTNTR